MAFFVQEYNQLIFLGLMAKPKYLREGMLAGNGLITRPF